MASPRADPWVVLCETERARWGGDLRRSHIFAVLAQRTAAVTEAGWNRRAVGRATRRAAGLPFPWRDRPRLASSEFLTVGATVLARRRAIPVALDVHDQPVVQGVALGRSFTPAERAALEDRVSRNLDLFPIHVAPSASFAALAGLDPERTIIAPNGSDTSRVVPRPFPDRPAIGFVSGAAPGRGIEALIEAARRIQAELPELRLLLWLAAGDGTGEAYVAALRDGIADATWITIDAVAYAGLGDALAEATVLVVPHPANEYLDVAVPVKLLDSMAAGRPVVVTPRTEARRIVEAADAGAVAAGDTPDDLAAAILPFLRDRELAARLGRNARMAAERTFDWQVIGTRVADAVLARLGVLEAGRSR